MFVVKQSTSLDKLIGFEILSEHQCFLEMNQMIGRMIVKKSTSNAQAPSRSGAALVEMALVLPVFLMVIFGIIEFGRGMMVGQMVTNAAREGARLGVISGNSNADVETKVKDFILDATGIANVDVAVTITITPDPSNVDPVNVLANSNTGDFIKVKVAVSAEKATLLQPDFLTGKSIVGIATMRHE